MCRVYHKAISLIPRVIKYVRWRHFLWFFSLIRWFDWLTFDFVSAVNVSRFRSYPVWMIHCNLYVYWITTNNNVWFLYSALPSSTSLLRALYRVLLPQRPLQSRDITSIGAAILMVLHERSTLYTSIKYHIQIWWSSQCRYWSLLSTTGTDHCSVDRWP